MKIKTELFGEITEIEISEEPQPLTVKVYQSLKLHKKIQKVLELELCHRREGAFVMTKIGKKRIKEMEIEVIKNKAVIETLEGLLQD